MMKYIMKQPTAFPGFTYLVKERKPRVLLVNYFFGLIIWKNGFKQEFKNASYFSVMVKLSCIIVHLFVLQRREELNKVDVSIKLLFHIFLCLIVYACLCSKFIPFAGVAISTGQSAQSAIFVTPISQATMRVA